MLPSLLLLANLSASDPPGAFPAPAHRVAFVRPAQDAEPAPKELIEGIVALMGDDAEFVRQRAVAEFLKLGPEAKPFAAGALKTLAGKLPLTGRFATDTVKLRKTLLGQLAAVGLTFDPDAGVLALKKGLDDEFTNVQLEAIKQLSTIAAAAKGDAGVDALIGKLSSEDLNIKKAAAAALGELGAKAKKALTPLTLLKIKDTDEDVRAAAEKAVAKIKAASPLPGTPRIEGMKE